MTLLTALILLALAVLVFLVMIVQGIRRTVELLTVRNLFLAGFLLFQLVSGVLAQLTGQYADVTIREPGSTGLIYIAMVCAFLAVFWLCYNRGWFVTRHAWKRSGSDLPGLSPSAGLSLAVLMLAVGIVLRVVIGRNVPILGVLTDMMGVGVLALAAGLAAWVWAPRLWNPAVAFPAAGVIVIACGTLLFMAFGRRDIVTVVCTVLFAAYYSRWRDLSLTGMTNRLALVGGAGLLLLAAFTTIRAATWEQQDISFLVRGLGEADVGEGIAAMSTGQNAAANSMWTIENYPDEFRYNPFASVVYVFTQGIPRAVWPDKPIPLGLKMVRQARVRGTSREYTMGPGIVGHIVHDNPWLTLVPYAAFLGLFCRWLDEHLRVRGSNPFVVLPITAGAGEILGLARGELGLFFFRAVVAMTAAWLAAHLCALLVGSARGASARARPAWGEADDEAPQEEPPPEGDREPD